MAEYKSLTVRIDRGTYKALIKHCREKHVMIKFAVQTMLENELKRIKQLESQCATS